LLAVLAVSAAQAARAQSSWDRYKPGTIASIIEQHDSTIRATWEGKPSEHFSGYDFPTLASVIYLGPSRPVSPHRLDIVRSWFKTVARDTSFARDFHREYLFQEGDQRMWLPVQDTVASFFPRELHPGQPVKLYVCWLGAYYEGRDITWAFIVNEFSTK
jgi:hypothetical protein